MTNSRGKPNSGSMDEQLDRFEALVAEGKISREEWGVMAEATVEEFLPPDPDDLVRFETEDLHPCTKSLCYLTGRVFYTLDRWEKGNVGAEIWNTFTGELADDEERGRAERLMILLAFDLEARTVERCINTFFSNILKKYAEQHSFLYARFHDCLDDLREIIADTLIYKSRDPKKEYMVRSKYWTAIEAFLMIGDSRRLRQMETEKEMQRQITNALERIEEQKAAETEQKGIVEVKPGAFGITVDIKEVAKRICKCICSRSKD